MHYFIVFYEFLSFYYFIHYMKDAVLCSCILLCVIEFEYLILIFEFDLSARGKCVQKCMSQISNVDFFYVLAVRKPYKGDHMIRNKFAENDYSN